MSFKMKLEYFVMVIGFFLLQKRAFGALDAQKYTIKTFVADRLATTVEETKFVNTLDQTENVSFAAFLPERAFISGFYITIGRERYESNVTRKEKSKALPEGVVYNFLSVRNSYKIGVDITVKPRTKVIFHLEYEQLLQKINGEFELVINISPGSLVPIMEVEVVFDRGDDPNMSKRPFMRAVDDFLLVPEVDLETNTNYTTNNITVTFKPDILTQLELICGGLRKESFEGVVGQFVVPFDLRMKGQGVTLKDSNNFVSFFAPSHNEPLPKHIVFILDTSASMFGKRINQLKQAMYSILPQLSEDDLFNLVEYDTSVYVWRFDDPDDINRTMVVSGNTFHSYYGHLESSYLKYHIFTHSEATPTNIKNAIGAIKKMNPSGNTNAMGGLEVGLYLIKLVQEKFGHQYTPLMVFLTDGEPNVGISDTDWIIDMTTELNEAQYKVPIFSISLGTDVDWAFLRALSLQNWAHATKIEVAHDTAQQLETFYDEINEPILGDIEFNGVPSGGNITRTSFPVMFQGSEVGVAGHGVSLGRKQISMTGKGRQDQVVIKADPRSSVANLTRIWANLMLIQLTEQFHATDERDFLHLAIELSLRESMLTEFTSLVINLPEDEHAIINEQNGLRNISVEKPKMPSFCSDLDGYVAKHYPYPITEEPEWPTEEPETVTNEEPHTMATEKIETTTANDFETFVTEEPETMITEEFKPTTARTFVKKTTKKSKRRDKFKKTTTEKFQKTTTEKPRTTTTKKPWTTTTKKPWTTKTKKPRTTTTEKSETTTTEKSETTTTKKEKDEEIDYGHDDNDDVNDNGNYGDDADNGNYGDDADNGDDDGGDDKDTDDSNEDKDADDGNGDKDADDSNDDNKDADGGNDDGDDDGDDNGGNNGDDGGGDNGDNDGGNDDGTDDDNDDGGTDDDNDDGNDDGDDNGGNDGNDDGDDNGGNNGDNDDDSGDNNDADSGDIGDDDSGDNNDADGDDIGDYDSDDGEDGREDDADMPTVDCHLRPKSGTCNDSLKKWAFDGLTANCTSFQYTGCGGNEHRFPTKRICENTCVHPKVSERCNLPISLGMCTDYSLKWFYSRRMRQCVEYEYGGCYGNDNRFDTEQECSQLCMPRFNPRRRNRLY